MKVIGILLVIGILFSYVPMIPMDGCPEGHHMGTKKMDCGYSFHCPVIFNFNMSESLPLPFIGQLDLASPLPKVDKLVTPIFHPPEYLILINCSGDEMGSDILAQRLLL